MCAVVALCLGFSVVAAKAQGDPAKTATPPGTTSAPVVDSSTAGPMTPPPPVPAVDAAAESSPTTGTPHGAYLPAHQEIPVRLQKAIDSAHLHNDELLAAMLTAPVRTSDGHTLPAGTRVGITVVAVAPVGKISSHGEITLQVTRVGSVGVISDALTFRGQSGAKELPDSAPGKGTEASVAAGTTLRFHVPTIAGAPPPAKPIAPPPQ
jgi:hypothetical protein